MASVDTKIYVLDCHEIFGRFESDRTEYFRFIFVILEKMLAKLLNQNSRPICLLTTERNNLCMDDKQDSTI